MRTIEHWIGGKPTSGAPGGTSPVWDPATGAQQAEVVLGSAADVDEAVRVAAAAFEEWSQASLSRRAKVLFAFRELATARAGELADLVSAEHGKVLSDARGEAARRFQRGVTVGMIGVNVPIRVPMAYYSFGGWKDSLFGQSRIHGPDGVEFYTRTKVVTERWPAVSAGSSATYHFPTST